MRFVDGFEDGEKEQEAVDKILLEILEQFGQEVKEKMKPVERLGEHVGMEYQREMLRRRWVQIGGLIQDACSRTQS